MAKFNNGRTKWNGNRFVTLEQYYREPIVLAFKALLSGLHSYFGYRLRFVPKWYKKVVDYTSIEKRRRNKVMSANLKYWRENGGLMVAEADTMEPIKSMADGNMYTSKAAYRHDLKGRGFEEVGNERQEPTELDNYYADQARENDINQDIKEALNGRRTN